MEDYYEFVECVEEIGDCGMEIEPTEKPQKGKIYELENIVKHEEFPEETYVSLKEIDGFMWHTDFFRPVKRDIISELMNIKAPFTPEIEKHNFNNRVNENA